MMICRMAEAAGVAGAVAAGAGAGVVWENPALAVNASASTELGKSHFR